MIFRLSKVSVLVYKAARRQQLSWFQLVGSKIGRLTFDQTNSQRKQSVPTYWYCDFVSKEEKTEKIALKMLTQLNESAILEPQKNKEKYVETKEVFTG